MSARLATAPSARLYVGKVAHARLKPVAHRFTYRVYAMLFDLDRLDQAARLSPFFSVDRFNLFSLRREDHGPRDGSSLRVHADRLLAQAGIPSGGRLFLLTTPRLLGYGFNPLSIYWRFDDDMKLRAVIYEVRNTFGDMHAYVGATPAPCEAGDTVKQEADKTFYVSPFMDMDLRYKFRLSPPDRDFRVRILEVDSSGPVLAATWIGDERPFCSANLLRLFISMPLETLKVIGAIHYEALRLWIKGLRLRRRPAAPAAPTILAVKTGDKGTRS